MRVDEARVYVLSPQLRLIISPLFCALQKNIREPLTLTPPERKKLEAALKAESEREL